MLPGKAALSCSKFEAQLGVGLYLQLLRFGKFDDGCNLQYQPRLYDESKAATGKVKQCGHSQSLNRKITQPQAARACMCKRKLVSYL